MKNQKAIDAFIETIGKIAPLLDDLRSIVVDNHMGVAPDNVNWGHVGTVNHLLEMVTEVSVAAGLRDE